jgi:iron complex outermembrane recepter protein
MHNNVNALAPSEPVGGEKMKTRSYKSALFVRTALSLGMAATSAVAQADPAAPAGAASKPIQLAQAFPPAAQASPAAPAPAAGLETIVVTARRRSERLQEVPISIKVLNQQQLAAHNIVTSTDLANYTPSLSVNSDFGSANTTFAIRGFVQDLGTQPSVATYFADVVAPRGGSNNIPTGDGLVAGTLFDLQNVQVLKGPQGTLFGLNTTGGAVLVVPQKPTSDYGGYIEAGYGNYDEKEVQAVINMPFSDTVRFRLGIDHESREGYEKNDTGIGPSNFGDTDYVALRASLVVDITPDLENYTIATFNHVDENGDVQKLIACNPLKSPPITALESNFLGILACSQLAQEQAKGAGFYTVQSTLPNANTDLKQWQVINTTTWLATDNITLKNIASYAQYQEDLNSALFGTNFDVSSLNPILAKIGVPGYPKGSDIDFASSLAVPNGSTANESTYTEEIQLQGHFLDDRLTYQGGFYVEGSDPLGLAGSESPVLLGCTDVATFDCINPTGHGSVNYTAGYQRWNDLAVYSQASYAITDQLKFTAGARYTWDSTTNDSSLISYSLPAKPNTTPVIPVCTIPGSYLPACEVDLRESSRAPTWLLNLDYNPWKDLLLYVNYSRGYRAGGISAYLPAPYDTFQPERVNTYEIGAKDTFDGMLKGTFDIDGFYNDFSNQQLQLGFDSNPHPPPGSPTVSPAAGPVNAGKSRIFGMEIDASVIPYPGVTLTLDYTYLNAQLQTIAKETLGPDSPYVLADLIEPGDPLALSPRNKLSLNGTYTLPLSPDIGRITFGATFTYTDTQVANYTDSAYPLVAGLSVLQSRHLLDLNANWNSIMGSHFDLQAYATNVTQDKYYTYVPGVYADTGFETANLGAPCFYGARLRFHF